MSEQSKRVVRGGVRAAIGVCIIGASVVTATLLGTGVVQLPSIDRGVVAVPIDTSQNARIALVCPGAFAELGADPTLPTAAVPSGESVLGSVGTRGEPRELAREFTQGSPPRVFEASAGDAVFAVESQQVATATLQGRTATSCVTPAHEQWLVGGGTTLGQSTTVVLGNPSQVPATVQLSFYDAEGQIEHSQATGVLVPAQSQRILPVNGFVPGRESIVVRVESSGAAVAAALSVSQTVDIRSYAVDTATRQLAPNTQLVFAGPTHMLHSQPGVELGTDGESDDFPVRLRLLAPNGEEGSATVWALFAEGEMQRLGSVELADRRVVEFTVERWDPNIAALLVESSTPLVGGVLASADRAPEHDYAWLAPAPELPVGEDVAVAVAPHGELVLVNPGTTAATVELRSDESRTQAQTIELAAGAATTVAAGEAVWLRSSATISAGVRIVAGAQIAAYPILPQPPRSAELTVYTR